MNCHWNHQRKQTNLRAITRRHFFQDCGVGVGKIALASLLASRMGSAFADEKPPAQAASTPNSGKAPNPLAPKPPHYKAKAKRVIFLFMAGAPSQLDLFDNKPHGTPGE